MKNKFIELPNGEAIHLDSFRAIRLGDPVGEHKPRVIVDFVVGDHSNCIALDCETVEQRDELAKNLKAQISQ